MSCYNFIHFQWLTGVKRCIGLYGGEGADFVFGAE